MQSKSLSWWAFGLANTAIVLVLGFGLWYLLVDPTTSLIAQGSKSVSSFYPFPFNEMLFWAILMVVFLGFNLELSGFDQLRQPLKGVVLTALTIGLAVGITYLFKAWGHYDPAFSSKVPEGNGYFLPALYVLFGFFTYLTMVINWDHWPWKDKGLGQPWAGIAEIGVATGPTIVLYAIFALPNLASWAKPGENILDVPTQIGVVYSIIVVTIITGLLTDNWPYRNLGGGGKTVLASLVGNIVGGIALYFVLKGVVGVLIGSADKDTLTGGDAPSFNEYPAQLGVCWAFWMILWSNVFDNRPTGMGEAANYVVRIVGTFVAAVATFLLYSYVVSEHLLHEAQIPDTSIYGNALGWMNWLVLMILFYVVYFESIGLPKQPEEVEAEEVAEPTATQPEASRAAPVPHTPVGG